MSDVSIPDDAVEDVPPPNGTPGKAVKVDQKQAEHDRKVDWVKHKFAIRLITWCLIGIVGLSVLDAAVPVVDGTPIGIAVDTLKLIATTALGFVFGRALSRSEG